MLISKKPKIKKFKNRLTPSIFPWPLYRKAMAEEVNSKFYNIFLSIHTIWITLNLGLIFAKVDMGQIKIFD